MEQIPAYEHPNYVTKDGTPFSTTNIKISLMTATVISFMFLCHCLMWKYCVPKMGEWTRDPINFYKLQDPTTQDTEFPIACGSKGLSLLVIGQFFMLTIKPAQKQKLYWQTQRSRERPYNWNTSIAHFHSLISKLRGEFTCTWGWGKCSVGILWRLYRKSWAQQDYTYLCHIQQNIERNIDQ